MVVAPVLRFKDVGFNANVTLEDLGQSLLRAPACARTHAYHCDVSTVVLAVWHSAMCGGQSREGAQPDVHRSHPVICGGCLLQGRQTASSRASRRRSSAGRCPTRASALQRLCRRTAARTTSGAPVSTVHDTDNLACQDAGSIGVAILLDAE